MGRLEVGRVVIDINEAHAYLAEVKSLPPSPAVLEQHRRDKNADQLDEQEWMQREVDESPEGEATRHAHMPRGPEVLYAPEPGQRGRRILRGNDG